MSGQLKATASQEFAEKKTGGREQREERTRSKEEEQKPTGCEEEYEKRASHKWDLCKNLPGCQTALVERVNVTISNT